MPSSVCLLGVRARVRARARGRSTPTMPSSVCLLGVRARARVRVRVRLRVDSYYAQLGMPAWG